MLRRRQQQINPRRVVLSSRANANNSANSSNIMKTFNQWIVAGAAVVFLGMGASQALAQRGGNFDPAQMQQRIMDRYKEQLKVKSDDEWKIISERIMKVMEARVSLGNGRGGFMGRRGGGAPGATTGTNDTTGD